jgi:hypothetical protein
VEGCDFDGQNFDYPGANAAGRPAVTAGKLAPLPRPAALRDLRASWGGGNEDVDGGPAGSRRRGLLGSGRKSGPGTAAAGSLPSSPSPPSSPPSSLSSSLSAASGFPGFDVMLLGACVFLGWESKRGGTMQEAAHLFRPNAKLG